MSSAYLKICLLSQVDLIKSVYIDNKTRDNTQPWGHSILQLSSLDLKEQSR